ncbi:hypothetical protein [Acinetobacter stercoris]|uniref:hypothetical protein n=1 Tax=Acinetobacter stercoris TaxID=2126983 RepID=UPI000EFBC42E|nr:hypothetical protein [Acinetobacter stercoris]
MPDHYLPPKEVSGTALVLVSAYNVIARSRQYEQGIPMPLSLGAINDYCEQYESPVPRWIFNDCIFALDNSFLEEASKRR